MTDKLPQEIQERIYAHEFGLLDDPVGRAIDQVIDAGVADQFVRGMLTKRVQKHKIDQAWNGPFSRPRLHEGDFCQGLDIGGKEIWYPVQLRNEPTINIATTGSGKTTLSRFEIMQFITMVRGLWCFDLRKTEFAVLKPYLARIGVVLCVLSARKMRLNLLQVPQGVDPTAYASNLADVLVAVLDLPPVSSRLLFQTLLLLYQRFGVLEGGTNYPTMFELLDAVAAQTQAHSQAREATIIRLESVLLSLRDVLCFRSGWTVDDLAQHYINFQFQDLGEIDQNLLLNILFLWVFMSRIARGVSNPKMDLMIFCDEASRLVSNSESSLSSWIGLIRGTGVGLSLSNQTAQLSTSILGNVPNKIIGRCSNAADYQVMGSAIGLTSEQRRWLTENLKMPGLFLCSLGQVKRPFLFRVPNLKFPPVNLDSQELDASLAALPVVPAPEFRSWQPRWVQQKTVIVAATAQPHQQEQPVPSGLTADEMRLLEAVLDHPCQPVSFYPRQAKMSNRLAIKVRRSLIDKGFIQEESVSTSSRGRPAKLLTPTEQAKNAFPESQSPT